MCVWRGCRIILCSYHAVYIVYYVLYVVWCVLFHFPSTILVFNL